MSNKTRNPNIDYGFHMVVPRIVRTGYKDITCIQKWLYTCLKDLCGDTGTCYRTLRVLSEETDMSTGMLSESIPALHKAGLIHAEKKRRPTGGKEVWHITIVDIWSVNAKEHPTKRSHGEQTTENENVQDVNVHNVNEITEECSCGERECSQIRHRSNNNISTNITEELTQDTDSAHAIASPPSRSHIIHGRQVGKNGVTSVTFDEMVAAQQQQSPAPLASSTLVSHPNHKFMWFDDLLAPSLMVVRLTPKFPSRYWSEMEDKRRQAIVSEVMPYLQRRGVKVTLRWEYETDQEIEQCLAENEKRSQLSTPSEQFSTTEVDNPQASVSGVSPITLPTDSPPTAEIALQSKSDAAQNSPSQNTQNPQHTASASTHSEIEALQATLLDTSTTSQPHDELTDIDTAQASNLRIASEDTGKPVTSKQSGRGTSTRPAEKVKPEIIITPEGLVIWDRWRSLFKKAMPLSESDARYAELFISLDPSTDDLKLVRGFCYVSNPEWFGRNGRTKGKVTLKDAFNNWAGWVASLESPDMPPEETPKIHRKSTMQASTYVPPVPPPALTPGREAEIKAALARLEQQKQSSKRGAIA